MEKILPSYIRLVLDRMDQKGYEAYLVGGSTRNFLLQLPIHDYDIASAAQPKEIIDLFDDYPQFYAGLKHGTVSIAINHQIVEITSYRIDGPYQDGRRPEGVSFTKSLREDLARRDFTINAIAYHPKKGFVDYFGGQEDLKNRCIRAIGQPDKRFEEDALRILRALRFASSLAFAIEEKTYASMLKNLAKLDQVSAERKAEELVKILLGKDVKRILLDYSPIFGALLAEIPMMKGFDQKNPYHCYDLLEHTARCIENSPLDREIRLAALLHDVGKLHSFNQDAEGIGHFYGHADFSLEIARDFLRGLKFDKEGQKNILTLIKYHDREILPSSKAVKRALNQLGKDLFFKLLDLKKADNLAQNPDLAYRLESLEEIKKLAQKILAEDQCFSLKNLDLDGRDLLALGLEGREIGQALDLVLKAVIEEEVENQKNHLLDYLSNQGLIPPKN